MDILCVLSRFPWPLEKGDKLRAYHFLRVMARQHRVHLVALSPHNPSQTDIQELQSFCGSVQVIRYRWWHILGGLLWALWHRRPFQVGYFYSRFARNAVAGIAAGLRPEVIFAQLIRVVPLVEKLPGIKIIDFQDSFSMNMNRRAAGSGGLLKVLFRREANAVQRYERRVFDTFDRHIIIAEPDRDEIDHPDRDRIRIVPNGVDFSWFRPDQQSTRRFDILFTGNMGYPPNIEGACWLAREILPEVRKSIPGATLLLAGANPTAQVKRLEGNGIKVTGWLDDIRDAYNSARVFVAPMRSGSGLQNKLLEAMAMGLPCVTTPLANASLQAEPGRQILEEETADGIARSIIQLLQTPTLASELADAGHAFVLNSYNWDRIMETFMQDAGLL